MYFHSVNLMMGYTFLLAKDLLQKLKKCKIWTCSVLLPGPKLYNEVVSYCPGASNSGWDGLRRLGGGARWWNLCLGGRSNTFFRKCFDLAQIFFNWHPKLKERNFLVHVMNFLDKIVLYVYPECLHWFFYSYSSFREFEFKLSPSKYALQLVTHFSLYIMRCQMKNISCHYVSLNGYLLCPE